MRGEKRRIRLRQGTEAICTYKKEGDGAGSPTSERSTIYVYGLMHSTKTQHYMDTCIRAQRAYMSTIACTVNNTFDARLHELLLVVAGVLGTGTTAGHGYSCSSFFVCLSLCCTTVHWEVIEKRSKYMSARPTGGPNAVLEVASFV